MRHSNGETNKTKDSELSTIYTNEFEPKANPHLFSAYLKVKYEVFVVEKKQTSLPHDPAIGRTLPDAFDFGATIVTVRLENAGVIGSLRITEVNSEDDFPHRHLLAHHLESASLRKLRAFKVTAVAIRKEFRGKTFTLHGSTEVMSAGQALMLAAVNSVRRQQGDLIFLSTDSKGALPFFLRLGFYMIDKPVKSAKQKLVNMAILVNDHESLMAISSPLMCSQDKPKLHLRELVARDYLQRHHRNLRRHLSTKKTRTAS